MAGESRTCFLNPINFVDPSGHVPLPATHPAYADGPFGLLPSLIDDGTEEQNISGNSGGNDKDVCEGTGKVTTYSDQLVEFVASREGFRSKAYNGGKTIGYGFDFYLYPEIKINYLEDGVSISEDEGRRLLKFMLDKFTEKLNSYLDEKYLSVNQNTFDALIDLYYNRNSNQLTKEVVVAMAMKEDQEVKRLLSDFDFRYAMKYIYNGNKEKSQAYVDRNPGLIKRREDEYEIYKNGFVNILIP